MVRGLIIPTLLVTGLVLFATSCRLIQTPGVKDPSRMLASFNHTGFTQSCSSCHEKNRPTPAHGGGKDCIGCHTPGAGWLNVTGASHNPLPSTCITCHLSRRPTGVVGSSGFNHSMGAGMGDCVSCHSQNAGVTWTGGFYKHDSSMMSCIECHLNKRPTGVINKFDHAIAGQDDCATCHNNGNIGVSWAGGVYNHSPAPSVCIDCHITSRPSGLVGPPGTQFDHARGGSGDCVFCHTAQPGTTWAGGLFSHSPAPTTCSSCHLTARPVGLIGPIGNQFDHAKGGTGDCSFCHKQPGITWVGGSYNHTPNPTTCSGCHIGARPVGLVGPASTQFDHAKGGTGDCSFCHKQPGVTWAGGYFSHSPAPASCSTCHSSERPTGTVGTTGHLYNHTNGGMGDCKSCHTANVGISWAGGNYSHSPTPTSCVTCHQGARPTGLVGPISSQFDHANGGMGDCVSCHKQPGVTWTGGNFSHSPAPTSCISCHLAKRPVGVINGYDHTNGGLGDCVSCHKQPGVTWTNGLFSHTPAPATCNNCHAADRPVGQVGPTGDKFDHASNGGTGDCVSCHKQPGVTWAGTQFSHSPVPTTCYTCHKTRITIGTVVPNNIRGFNHATTYGTECASCHTKVPANIGVRWSGGDYSHSPAPSSCNACHLGLRPTVNYTLPSGGPKGTRYGHTQGDHDRYDCARCHTYTIGTSWVIPNAQTANCRLCH